jgi:hypothetical protein
MALMAVSFVINLKKLFLTENANIIIDSAASSRGQAIPTYFIHDSGLVMSVSCFLFTHAKKLYFLAGTLLIIC